MVNGLYTSASQEMMQRLIYNYVTIMGALFVSSNKYFDDSQNNLILIFIRTNYRERIGNTIRQTDFVGTIIIKTGRQLVKINIFCRKRSKG